MGTDQHWTAKSYLKMVNRREAGGKKTQRNGRKRLKINNVIKSENSDALICKEESKKVMRRVQKNESKTMTTLIKGSNRK